MIRKPFLVAGIISIAGLLAAIPTVYASGDPTVQPQISPSPPTFDPSTARQTTTAPPRKLKQDAPCRPIYFGFEGNPRGYEGQILARYRVPTGRKWRITNTSVMMERHHGGPYAVAGEWTGVVGASTESGRMSIATSSLDNFSGIASQGQGPANVTLGADSKLMFTLWLRPYTNDANGRVATDPTNYYYTLGASGMDCPA